MTHPGYPPPGPGYPPQNQPQYPPAPGYPPQNQPNYPPPSQGYYPPPPAYAPPPPPTPTVRAEIDDFYDQPSASGKSIASWFQTPGQSLTGVVARPITKADLRAQTDMQTKQPKYFSDGRQMLTMTVPLLVQPSQDFPDGRAAWIVGSSDKEELDAAIQAAGLPPRTVPEAGAVITITFTGFKQIPGFGAPKKVKTISYQRPNGAPPVNPTGPTPSATAPAPGPAPATSAPPATAGYAGYQPQYQEAPPPNTYAGQPGPSAYQVATGQPQQPPFEGGQQPPGAPPPPQYGTPDGLTPEQAERLRQITGQ